MNKNKITLENFVGQIDNMMKDSVWRKEQDIPFLFPPKQSVSRSDSLVEAEDCIMYGLYLQKIGKTDDAKNLQKDMLQIGFGNRYGLINEYESISDEKKFERDLYPNSLYGLFLKSMGKDEDAKNVVKSIKEYVLKFSKPGTPVQENYFLNKSLKGLSTYGILLKTIDNMEDANKVYQFLDENKDKNILTINEGLLWYGTFLKSIGKDNDANNLYEQIKNSENYVESGILTYRTDVDITTNALYGVFLNSLEKYDEAKKIHEGLSNIGSIFKDNNGYFFPTCFERGLNNGKDTENGFTVDKKGNRIDYVSNLDDVFSMPINLETYLVYATDALDFVNKK
jgi:hypothetical protein